MPFHKYGFVCSIFLRFMSMQLRRKFLNDVSGVFSCVLVLRRKQLIFPLLTWCMYAFQDCHSELVPTSSFIYVKNAQFLIYIKTLSLYYPRVVVEAAHEVLIGLYSIYYYTSVLEDVCFVLRSHI